MTLAVTERELAQLLSEVPFTRSYGFRLQSIGDGECSLSVPFQPAFERPGGIVSGQVFMAAADVAMWLAIMTRLGTTDGAVTAEMTTNFLKGAKQESFVCRAHPEAWPPADLRRCRVCDGEWQFVDAPHGHLYSRGNIAS